MRAEPARPRQWTRMTMQAFLSPKVPLVAGCLSQSAKLTDSNLAVVPRSRMDGSISDYSLVRRLHIEIYPLNFWHERDRTRLSFPLLLTYSSVEGFFLVLV